MLLDVDQQQDALLRPNLDTGLDYKWSLLLLPPSPEHSQPGHHTATLKRN